MDTVKLSKYLEGTTYQIKVFEDEKIISKGSAFPYTKSGHLLTANHVIASAIDNPDIKIIAKNAEGAEFKYTLGQHNIGMSNELFKVPLIVDLATLNPESPFENLDFLKIYENTLNVGEKVLMAGFPDEGEWPLEFNYYLDRKHPDVKEKLKDIPESGDLLLIKSGMISRRSEVNLIGKDKQISGEIFYIDNAMHSGASGGPVINANGEAVGVISQRAMTEGGTDEIPDLKIPSGSAVAISPRFLKGL